MCVQRPGGLLVGVGGCGKRTERRAGNTDLLTDAVEANGIAHTKDFEAIEKRWRWLGKRELKKGREWKRWDGN